jgi:3-oxoacyl-[acyl-carrier protein] reductase
MKKVALILGASEGLGYACAEALIKENVYVCIVSRNEEKLKFAFQKLEKIKKNYCIIFQGDLREPNLIRNVIDQISIKWGIINILVNSNNGPKSGSVTNLTDQEWGDSFNSYALPVFRAIREVLPGMKSQKWGRIITIGSIAAVEPIVNLDISNFIRSGFLGIHKSLSREVANDNINVHVVLPGSIYTNRTQERIEQRAKNLNITNEESIAISVAKIPKMRIGDPSDVGNLVAFLCSKKADYLTGSSFTVDGGMSVSI